jgi:hypothetical protein
MRFYITSIATYRPTDFPIYHRGILSKKETYKQLVKNNYLNYTRVGVGNYDNYCNIRLERFSGTMFSGLLVQVALVYKSQ